MSNISFIIFTYNEESRVEYVVRNLAPYGDVFILDDGSTDRTKEIVEKFGGHFVLRPKTSANVVENQEMLDFVRGLIKTDWVMWAYVDNLFPKTLLDKLAEISKQDKYKQVFVPIHTYLWGEAKQPVIKASYSNFFKAGMVDFTGNRMHGLGTFTGTKDQILHLPDRPEFAIRHFSLYDLTKFVTGHLRYANAEAVERFAGGKRFSVTYMFGSMGRYFYLFYKRGWKAGVRGLYGALLYSFFRLMVSVRLYELEHNLTLETIEAEFAKEKKKMVEEVETSINPSSPFEVSNKQEEKRGR